MDVSLTAEYARHAEAPVHVCDWHECIGGSQEWLGVDSGPERVEIPLWRRASERRSIYTASINVPIAGTAGRGNKAIVLPSRTIVSRFSLSSHNLSNVKRADSLSGCP